MRRLLTGKRHGRRSSLTSSSGTPDEDFAFDPEDGDSPLFDSTQEVVWRESPKFYKPLARHSTDLVRKELTIIQDMLADKENNRGPPVTDQQEEVAAAAVVGEASSFQVPSSRYRSSHHASGSEGGGGGKKTPVPSPARKRAIRPQAASQGGEGSTKNGAGTDSQTGGGRSNSFSSSLFRNLLFRKSPAPATRHKRGSAGTPTKRYQQASGLSSSGRKRARLLSLEENADESGPPPPIRPRAPPYSASSDPIPSNVSPSAKPKADSNGGGGGMSILGGLARSLKQGGFKLNLWQCKNNHQKQQQQHKGEDETTSSKCGPGGEERREATGGKKPDVDEEEDEVDTQRFLHILEKIEEKLSQDDTKAVGKSIEEKLQEEEKEGEHSKEERGGTMMATVDEVAGQQIEEPQGMPMDIDDEEINPPAEKEPVAGPREPETLPTPIPTQVDPPPSTLMEILPEGQGQAVSNTGANKVQDRQPWDEDDSNLWNDSEWATVLQLTQGPAEPAAQALNKTEDIPLERSAAPEIVENPMIDMSSSSAPSLPSSATICDEAPYDRYVVKAIQEENGGRTKIIQAKHLASGWEGSLTVGEPWSDCHLEQGDIIHVIGTQGGDFESGGERPTVIDDKNAFLIAHPDILVSPSTVISGLDCMRRAVLQDIISSSAYQSKVAVLGNLKHSMVQDTLLLLNDRDRTFPILIDGTIVEEMERVADSVVARNRVTLFGMAIPEPEAKQQLLDLVRPLVDWARLYCIPGSQQQNGARHGDEPPPPIIQIDKTESVEENIWSAAFGLKGQIDATLLVQPIDSLNQLSQRQGDGSSSSNSHRLLPLEIKSGSNAAHLQLKHRAQVMLYSLLLRDRYGQKICYDQEAGDSQTPEGGSSVVRAGRLGVLAYVGEKGVEAIPVPPKDADLRQLLVTRNHVAKSFTRSIQSKGLPPVLSRAPDCSRCFQLAECMVYHQGVESGTAQTSALGPLFNELTGHLESKDQEYLAKWNLLIGLEAITCSNPGRDIWHRKASAEEKKSSKCLSDMACVGAEARASLDGPSYVYTFCRRKWVDPVLCSQVGEIPRSLLELALSVGDRVLISTESRLRRSTVGAGLSQNLVPFKNINMTSGNIIGLSESSVDIACTKALTVPGYPGFPFITSVSTGGCRSSVSRQEQGMMMGGTSAAGVSLAYEEADKKNTQGILAATQMSIEDIESRDIIFRIDRDTSSLNFAMMRYNVVRLFTGPAVNVNANVAGSTQKKGLRLAPSPGDDKRRRLVVHLDAPKFTHPPSVNPIEAIRFLQSWGKAPPTGCTADELREEFQRLNSDQQAAMEKVVTARDYALLLGMPGTGKTWTLAFIIRALLCTGRTVLITSYTHTAVDNLLLKLREHQVPFLRLGKASQVNPALHDALLESGDALSSAGALETRLRAAKVVATTCLGIRHALLASRQFDVCVVDEAGQILEPVCLGPLRSAATFVLVGDDNQLPPLVVSNEAQEGGMTESLFSRLSAAHPDSVQRLTYQYRMNRDIMYVCNELVYEHRLKCGDDTVANATLVVPGLERVRLMKAEGIMSNQGGWLEKCLAEDRSVVFLNTDGISPEPLEDGLVDLGGQGAQQQNRDKDCPSNLTNPTEARLVCQIVSGLMLGGIRAESMAVISPLRSQLKRLRREMAHIRRLEINTVDKLQGMDRDCIIISLVRSNMEGKVGGLLQDRRRINVAVSRAKRKLIIVGSANTLSQAQTTGDLVNLMRARGWILDLPTDAHLAYEERNLDTISAISSSSTQ